MPDLPPCPVCGGRLLLRFGLQAKPVGSFSVAGSNPKVAAVGAAVLACTKCDFAEVGKPVKDGDEPLPEIHVELDPDEPI